MTKELIVKPEDFQLETEKAVNIQKSFSPKLQEQEAYMSQYQNIVDKEITPELVEQASELRKRLKKVRTSTERIRKSEKNYYLQAGKFVDAIGKKITVPVQEMESKLEEIEDYYDRLEREKQEKLANERYEALESYVEDPYVYDVGEMEQEVFEAFLYAKKEEFKKRQKEEEERLKEEQRQEELQKTYSKRKDAVLHLGDSFDWEKLSADTTEKEFEKLKKDAIAKKEEKDKELEKLRKQQEEQQKQQEKLNKRRQELQPYYSIPDIKIKGDVFELNDEDFNTELKRLKELKQKYLKQKEQKRKEEEKRQQELRELQRQKEEKERIEKEKLEANDKDKIQYLLNDVKGLISKYEFSSKKFKTFSENVDKLLNKVLNYIKEQS